MKMIKINLYAIWKYLFPTKAEPLDPKMILKSRWVDGRRYEINGVILNADSHLEAIRKYRREKK